MTEIELREDLVRDLESVRRVIGEIRHPYGSLESHRQAGELNGLAMALAVVRNDHDDPALLELERMMQRIADTEPGVVIPDARELRFNPRPPRRRLL